LTTVNYHLHGTIDVGIHPAHTTTTTRNCNYDQKKNQANRAAHWDLQEATK